MTLVVVTFTNPQHTDPSRQIIHIINTKNDPAAIRPEKSLARSSQSTITLQQSIPYENLCEEDIHMDSAVKSLFLKGSSRGQRSVQQQVH